MSVHCDPDVNNTLGRIPREIVRRTRVVVQFSAGQSALNLVAARLRRVRLPEQEIFEHQVPLRISR